MADPKIVYVVEYGVSARGDDVRAHGGTVAFTLEQFQEWVARADKYDEIDQYLKKNGKGVFFFGGALDEMERDEVNKALNERGVFLLDLDEGLIGVGYDFDAVVAAMRKNEVDLGEDAQDDFELAEFTKPSLPDGLI